MKRVCHSVQVHHPPVNAVERCLCLADTEQAHYTSLVCVCATGCWRVLAVQIPFMQ